MATALTEFLALLGEGIVTLAGYVASGVAEMAQALFLKVNATTGAVEGLSIFGGLIGMFAGVSLSIGITTKVFIWVTSLGKN